MGETGGCGFIVLRIVFHLPDPFMSESFGLHRPPLMTIILSDMYIPPSTIYLYRGGKRVKPTLGF